MKNAAAVTGLVILVLMGLYATLELLATVTTGLGPTAAEYGGSYMAGRYTGMIGIIALGGWALYRLSTRGNRAQPAAGPRTFTPVSPADGSDQR